MTTISPLPSSTVALTIDLFADALRRCRRRFAAVAAAAVSAVAAPGAMREFVRRLGRLSRLRAWLRRGRSIVAVSLTTQSGLGLAPSSENLE